MTDSDSSGCREALTYPCSLLDDWRAEVGDEEVARIAEATRRDAASGVLPGFTDREALLAHLRGGRRPVA